MKIEEYSHLFIEMPCKEAQEWLESQPSLEEAWDKCPHGDWLWWALMNGRGTMPKQSLSVRYTTWCIRRIKLHAVDNAIDAYTADAYAAARAADAAYAAARAADTPRAAAYAAHAAARDAAYAAARAADTPRAAAYAAYAAARAADAAYAAAYFYERKAQADWIRKHIPYPF